MNQPLKPVRPRILRVLVATQSALMGTMLANFLDDPADIGCEVVSLTDDLCLTLSRVQPPVVSVVLLDLEPWPANVLHTVHAMKDRATPLLVLALAHSVGQSMQRRCHEAGVDHLLDRTADLGRLQRMMADYAQTQRSKAMQRQESQ